MQHILLLLLSLSVHLCLGLLSSARLCVFIISFKCLKAFVLLRMLIYPLFIICAYTDSHFVVSIYEPVKYNNSLNLIFFFSFSLTFLLMYKCGYIIKNLTDIFPLCYALWGYLYLLNVLDVHAKALGLNKNYCYLFIFFYFNN